MDAQALRQLFDRTAPLTVGIEEELMLLDAQTLELAPRAPELLRALGADPRVKLELPAAQLELVTPPSTTVADAVGHLRATRAHLAEAAGRLGLRLAGAGAHPFSAPLGTLNGGARYDATHAEYGAVAEAQLVCGLHVHVAVGGADAVIAVHDALRSHLPELAALAAAAPFYAGRDTGLASVRPEISTLLPRQGVPPALGSVEEFAAQLAWGAAAGAVADPRRWWWELRPHPIHGTLEVRVCDTQPDVRGAGALAGVVHALVAELAARHARGELPPPAAGWRIAENRWSACRYGLGGRMADLATGGREPTARRVGRLLDEVAGAAHSLGCDAELGDARRLLEAGGDAARQRAVGAERGAHGLTAWLADRFLADEPPPPPRPPLVASGGPPRAPRARRR
ncbi:MAG: glutamate---cysteine ligase / carboxylate-amine ligase [Solirubrobacteraceae bacterium]|nr:glutamate---cysteine ligase / carboxylate-amine ligase [Solirubrobacteraceae bacterium]